MFTTHHRNACDLLEEDNVYNPHRNTSVTCYRKIMFILTLWPSTNQNINASFFLVIFTHTE